MGLLEICVILMVLAIVLYMLGKTSGNATARDFGLGSMLFIGIFGFGILGTLAEADVKYHYPTDYTADTLKDGSVIFLFEYDDGLSNKVRTIHVTDVRILNSLNKYQPACEEQFNMYGLSIREYYKLRPLE